jgi:ectoine hydroxylase-related dioxygenase (phytanoyl-CoA dioxygenase family)
VVSEVIGRPARAVRAILFDKTEGNNWPLGWHQDRTIAVAERRDVPGFAHWNEKGGIAHVEPPFDLLARMVTMRIHIDAVDRDNAPLLVALGTHRLGRIAVPAIAATVAAAEIMPCLADAGDVWLYATPVLHASEPAACPRRRRVLQIDWSADALPSGLRWTGLDDDGRGVSLERRRMLA